MKNLIERIKNDATIDLNSTHGMAHWQRVADFGCRIAANEDVKARILLLFAFFHDCQRLSEFDDPDHGPRAASYVTTFSTQELGLDEQDKYRLIIACRHHTYECETDDLTIMACWDSDRLDLGRLDIIPDPERLYTNTARRIARGDF